MMPMSEEQKKIQSDRMKAIWGKRRAEAAASKANGVVEGASVEKVRDELPGIKSIRPATSFAPHIPSPAGPRAVESAPPVLTLHRASGGMYLLRTFDAAYNDTIIAIAKSLPADATDLMLVTPGDTKQFKLGGSSAIHNTPVREAVREDSVDGEDNGASQAARGEGDNFEEDPQVIAQRLAAEAPDIEPGLAARTLSELEAEAATAETPAQHRAALTEIRRQQNNEAGQTDVCGRCNGSGTRMVAMPSGDTVQQACPVCSGRGHVRRFGVRRG